MALALLSMAVDLATTGQALAAWGREHAPLISSQSDEVIQLTRARYADRLAVLKERQ